MDTQPTGKEKASRIPLDYHRRADPLVRMRLALTALAALCALGYIAWGFITPTGAMQHTHGPVAAVHATWESQCSACHVDFAPIRDDAWAASWHGASDARWIHAGDAKCQACHAGPAHSAREKSEDVASCSSCHREHQGRWASLARMDDQHCTRCHARLSYITSWQQDHPDFRSLKHDPGTIQFTHARHMSLGLRTAPDDRVQMKLTDLAPDDRERYRRPGQGDHELVQLECSSCHRLDAMSGYQASSAAPPGGDYMLGVSYEQHCRACHPLTIDPQDAQRLLPHGLFPAQIRTTLLGQLAEELLNDAPVEWRELLKRPVPTKEGERPPREPLNLLTERVLKAERHVQRTCGKCHEFDSDEAGAAATLPESLVPAYLGALPPPVRPASIPHVWLLRARFDHASHRAVDCRVCHAAAYADHPQASKDRSDVLIAGRAACLTCHSPPQSTADGPRGGARHDCAECHRYHAADQPPHGRGSPLRDALEKLP